MLAGARTSASTSYHPKSSENNEERTHHHGWWLLQPEPECCDRGTDSDVELAACRRLGASSLNLMVQGDYFAFATVDARQAVSNFDRAAGTQPAIAVLTNANGVTVRMVEAVHCVRLTRSLTQDAP
jgi:hypothetical protein